MEVGEDDRCGRGERGQVPRSLARGRQTDGEDENEGADELDCQLASQQRRWYQPRETVAWVH